MKNRMKTAAGLLLCGLLFLAPYEQAEAEDVDFSCMSYRIWDKSQLSDRYSEHDVVLTNSCPGAVYWAFCIERVDPWTGEIMETHSPVGYVRPEQKARVNLQMKKGKHFIHFRNRYQGFYVNAGFAIDQPASVQCRGQSCEAKKRDLRAVYRTNLVQWDKAIGAMNARIKEECPTSGWDNATSEECEAHVKSESQAELNAFAIQDQEYRDTLAATDPENCQVWAAGLTND